MPGRRYPWQTEERLAAEAALRALGVVTASMGGNLAAGADEQPQANPLPTETSSERAPSPDNVPSEAEPLTLEVATGKAPSPDNVPSEASPAGAKPAA